MRQPLPADQDALGLPGTADPAFRIVAEKTGDHLLIQQSMPEMGTAAILLHQDV